VIEIEVHMPAATDPKTVPVHVEQAAAREELIVAMRGTLGTYPGCVH